MKMSKGCLRGRERIPSHGNKVCTGPEAEVTLCWKGKERRLVWLECGQ